MGRGVGGGGEVPLQRRIFGSTPIFNPLGVYSNPPSTKLWKPKMSPDITKSSMTTSKITLDWEMLLYIMEWKEFEVLWGRSENETWGGNGSSFLDSARPGTMWGELASEKFLVVGWLKAFKKQICLKSHLKLFSVLWTPFHFPKHSIRFTVNTNTMWEQLACSPQGQEWVP